MLIVVFGLLPGGSTVQAQAATLTVTPSATTDVATENTYICAKCGGTDAQFTISVTDAAQNTSATTLQTVTVTVKNLELGTLGTLATADSNPKTVTLVETGVNTSVFTRVVAGANASSGLVSDKLTGTADGGSNATTLVDDVLNTANATASNRAAIIGGTVLITSAGSAAPQGERRTISGFTTATGTVTTAAFSAVVQTGDAYTLFPLVNHPVFTGQTIQVSYTQAGSLGQSKTISNEEVKPTIILASPALDYITKAATTVLFQADITDTGGGFPEKAADIVDNNTAGTKGRIQLFIGTSAVALTSANYTAIDNGWRVAAQYNSTDIQSIAGKVAWWIQAEDLAGNVQEPSEGSAGTASANGSTTTIVDSALAGMAAGSLVGRTVTITFSGVAETVAITGYATGTGTLTTAAFSAAVTSGTKYAINKTLLVTVDSAAPTLTAAVTGDNWNSGKAAGARLRQTTSSTALGSRTSVRLTFSDASGLDTATVVPSAFTVVGNTVSSVLLVDIVGENASPSEQRIPNDVFLTLGTAVASAAKPKVTVASSIKDKAGNAFAGSTSTPTDKIGPLLTLTLDNALSKKQVKATIVTDELLVTAPSVTVKVLNNTTTGALSNVSGSAVGSVAQSGTLTYSQTTKIASIAGNTGGSEFNLYVTANDTGASGGNMGTKGNSTSGVATSSITFELDQWLNNGLPPKVDVAGVMAEATTASVTGAPNVDQVDPLIVTVDFNKGCTAGNACAGSGEGAEYTGDSYKTVTLTKATVTVTFADGTTETTTYDVANDVKSPDNQRFTLPIQAPKVGTYALTIQAVDTAGNDNLKAPTATSPQSLSYAWKVKAASPVKLSLAPGWNLLSLPFQPANPAINSVIPATHPIDLVMSYDNVNQVWLVSRRDATSGLFVGDVTVMTASTAYFVRTDNFQELSILQPPVATQAAAPPPPPVISVAEGWNLVPVLSLDKPLPTEIAADTYFGTLGLNWLKAMTYDPLTRNWQSVTRATAATTMTNVGDTFTDDCGVVHTAVAANETVAAQVCIGKGYWLYASKTGVIIP